MDRAAIIHHPKMKPIVLSLLDRAKGYSGEFRQLLEDAANLIKEYQKKKPFETCMKEYSAFFIQGGMERAARIADGINPEVAAAIRAAPTFPSKEHDNEKV